MPLSTLFDGKKGENQLVRWWGSLYLLLFLAALSACSDSVPVKKIALIGRYDDLEGRSGSNEWYDRFVALSLDAYLEELNRAGGAVRYQLVPFNIHHDPQRSDSVYRQIARDDDFILALDNSWGHDMAGAQATILENRIPVLSLNAYKGDLDYGPNTLFLIDYESNIDFLAAFVEKVIRADSVDFISEDDVVFHDHFLRSFNRYQLPTAGAFTYTGQQNINRSDSIRLFQALHDHFVTGGRTDNRTVVYNAHFMWGNAILDFLNEHLTDSRFLSWSVPQKEFIEKLKNGNQLILYQESQYDVSEPVYETYRRLFARYPDYFSWDGSASLMEENRNVVYLLQEAEKRYGAVQLSKEKMARFLEEVGGNGLTGKDYILEFNEQGKLINDKIFTVYSERGQVSHYPFQLNADREVIPSFSLGIDLESIYDIDFNSSSFSADFDFWITGDSSYQEVGELIKIRNLRSEGSSVELLTERFEHGQFMKRYSVSGNFHTAYQASSYPFDRQELIVSIEVLDPSDAMSVTINPLTFEKDIQEIKINGWQSRDYYVTLNNYVDRDVVAGKETYVEASTLDVHFLADRNYLVSLLQIVLPLFFIGAISIGILYLRRLAFSDLGEVIVGLFLSIIAFSISLSQLSPKFDSLTKADLLFLLTFLIVFFVFILLIVINSGGGNRYASYVPFMRRVLTWLYPILFIVISVY